MMYASKYGRGTALKVLKDCETYTVKNTTVPYVQASVIHNQDKKEVVVFATNLSLDEDVELSLELEGFDTATMVEHIELYSDDV